MATLTVNNVMKGAGFTSAPVAADVAGDEFVNDGSIMLHVVNGGAGQTVLTFASVGTIDGLDKADLISTIEAGVVKFIGPFPVGSFNDAAGKVQVAYSVVTSLTVEAVRLP